MPRPILPRRATRVTARDVPDLHGASARCPVATLATGRLGRQQRLTHDGRTPPRLRDSPPRLLRSSGVSRSRRRLPPAPGLAETRRLRVTSRRAGSRNSAAGRRRGSAPTARRSSRTGERSAESQVRRRTCPSGCRSDRGGEDCDRTAPSRSRRTTSRRRHRAATCEPVLAGDDPEGAIGWMRIRCGGSAAPALAAFAMAVTRERERRSHLKPDRAAVAAARQREFSHVRLLGQRVHGRYGCPRAKVRPGGYPSGPAHADVPLQRRATRPAFIARRASYHPAASDVLSAASREELTFAAPVPGAGGLARGGTCAHIDRGARALDGAGPRGLRLT